MRASRVLLCLSLCALVGALRLGQLTKLRGPESSDEAAKKVDAKNSAISDRVAKEEYCAEKKCKEASKYYCGKQCVEKESECAPGTKDAALKEASDKQKCEEDKKVWCRGKCNAPKDCPDFAKVDCDNLKTAAATGPAEPPKKEEKKKPETTTAAPEETTTTTTPAPDDEDEKKPMTMTACEMVKPWETNQYYLKHVLPGPPKTKSFCCLAMIRELANRAAALAEKLANCEPKDSDECQRLAKELAGLKALLSKMRSNAGVTPDDEKEFTKANANDFDKHMTKDWTDHKMYKQWVEPHPDKIARNETQNFTMSKDEEAKKFPIGSAVGRDQYAPDDPVTLQHMKKHQEKVAKKEEKKKEEKKEEKKKEA